jgi:Zn-dependent peptidase ImmA (M78 family)
MNKFTESQLKKIFYKIRNDSYFDYCSDYEVIFKKMKVLGQFRPFFKKIKINLSLINKNSLSKEAVIGIIAHELGHVVFFKKLSFLKKIYLLSYFVSNNTKKWFEREADLIAINMGYKKQLIEGRKNLKKCYADNPDRLETVKKVYLTVDELTNL